MTQIIEHLMPNTELNLQTLKAYVSELGNNATENPPTPSTTDVVVSPSCAIPSPSSPVEEPSANEGAIIAEEINGVYSDVGRLRVDSRGVQSKSYRARMPIANWLTNS